MHNFTPEDLICYLYKETSPELTQSIEQAIEKDWTLREKLAVLKASHERLNTIIQSPRTEIILAVLKHAANKEVLTS
jgi:hypothetical protein